MKIIHRLFFILLACLSFAPAQSAPPLQEEIVEILKPQLNSDRIEYFFGSFGIELLHLQSCEFPENRVSNLYSIHNNEKVMRTLALVTFEQPVHPLLQETHKEITKGKAIGMALQHSGWKIKKTPTYFGSFYLDEKILQWMQEKQSNQAAIHVYELSAYRDDQTPIRYCTIAEIHSPQYLSIEWLKALYPEQWNAFTEQTEKITAFLDQLSQWARHFPTKGTNL